METITKPVVNEPDTGSPDDKAHYVDKGKLGNALVNGGKVRAICGVMFEPIRDPTKFPVCEECVEILKLRKARKKALNN
jgi:hypothetical protein